MKYESPSALEMAVKAAAKASPLDTNLAIRMEKNPPPLTDGSGNG